MQTLVGGVLPADMQSGVIDRAVRDLAAKVVKWPATLHFGSYWARRVVGEVWSDQSVGHVKLKYDCPDCILLIAFVVNKYPTLFNIKCARKKWLRDICAEIVIFKIICVQTKH